MTDQAKLYDVRYSRYSGSREARWRSVLALARSSTTRALGLRRTTGAKVWPFLLITLAHLPVVAAVGVPMLFDQAPSPLELLPYSQMMAILTPVLIAFAATTLPSLLTRERKDRVLSLYFSTAVSRVEYLLGKGLAALALMSLVTLSPLLVLLIGSILTADAPLDAVRDDGAGLPGVVAGGLVIALFYASLGLLAGSLTAKRIFAIGGLLAALLVTPILFTLVFELSGQEQALAGDLAQAPLRATTDLLPGEGFDDEHLIAGPSSLAVWSVVVGAMLLSAAVLAFRYLDEDAS
jgi:ABC-2 type transport system permease protein